MIKFDKISNPQNSIIIIIGNNHKVKDSNLLTFIDKKLKLVKGELYKVERYTAIRKTKFINTIVLKVKSENDFNCKIENIVTDIGSIIKSLNDKVYLDLDKSSLSQESKSLFLKSFLNNLYSFDIYKTDSKIKYGLIVNDSHLDKQMLNSYFEVYKSTRDRICTSAEYINPETFENIVTSTFKNNPKVKITIFQKDKLQELNMGGIYGVGRGSDIPPRLIILEYKPRPNDRFKYGLVGKGVTYDSGGYNLKPTGYIEDMFTDMAGASVSLGVFEYLVKIGYNENIVVALPVVENLISGKAQKPGDVIKMYNGKTVEIGNSDAEGRLILADSLAYIDDKYEPKYLFDIATLTGSQIVALGRAFGGLIGNNEKLNSKLQQFSNTVKERVWELPNYEPYFKSMSSDFADYRNLSAGKYAPGCVTAGLFLGKFVKCKNRIHLDVAGPIGGPSLGADPLYGPYPTAFGLHLLTEFFINN